MKLKLPIFAIALMLLPFGYSQAQTPSAAAYLQKKGEVYFAFPYSNKAEINQFSQVLSIDKITSDSIFAYANKDEFAKFEATAKPYTVLVPAGDLLKNVAMYDGMSRATYNWNEYPSYGAYVSMMQQFAADYPSICKLVELGTTKEGRKLLALRISDNIAVDEAEPRTWLSSSMHGDELTGYVNLLRLADYILTNYEKNTQITKLVNGLEMWICPLENPDGTFFGGNNSVQGAKRYNANDVDLNRHYKHPLAAHPDGKANYEKEAAIMMALSDTNRFTVSLNFHGGAQIFNFPFDAWTSKEKTHADDAWWMYVGHNYVNLAYTTAKDNFDAPGYLQDKPDIGDGEREAGLTEGADWYPLKGTRQEYLGWYCQTREATVEISTTKLPEAYMLPLYWEFNCKPMLNYMEEALNGIHGIVKDSLGNPLKVLVTIQNHDRDNSEVSSYANLGDFHRPIVAGTYNVVLSAPGYNYNATVKNVVVVNGQPTDLGTIVYNVSLFDGIAEMPNSQFRISPNPCSNTLLINPMIATSANTYMVEMLDLSGTTVIKSQVMEASHANKLDVSALASGTYVLRIITAENAQSYKVIKM